MSEWRQTYKANKKNTLRREGESRRDFRNRVRENTAHEIYNKYLTMGGAPKQGSLTDYKMQRHLNQNRLYAERMQDQVKPVTPNDIIASVGAKPAPVPDIVGNDLFTPKVVLTKSSALAERNIGYRNRFAEGTGKRAFNSDGTVNSVASDDAIRKQQQFLIDSGYDLGPMGADGLWGRISLKAWKQYLDDIEANKTKQIGTVNDEIGEEQAYLKNGGSIVSKFQLGGSAQQLQVMKAFATDLGIVLGAPEQLAMQAGALALLKIGEELAKQLFQVWALAEQQQPGAGKLILAKALGGGKQSQQTQPRQSMNGAPSASYAMNGTKLNRISQLINGRCPEGYEVEKFLSGGCVKCRKKAQLQALEMKCGGKKRFTKKENGGLLPLEKCGGKAKKKINGGELQADNSWLGRAINKKGISANKCGGKTKKK